ncbi:MAG: NAD-binding protein [Candidatus Thermoplasmatota archaeon]|nr:NAD-binding protein [Candidatus Thermoplasmatota archaeon]
MQIGFLFSKIWKFLAIFVFVLLISSLLFYQFEYVPEDERGDSYSGPEGIYDSFWFGIVTLSAVGYGDRFPVTSEGKIAALFLVIFTFTFLGAMIGMVSDAVMEARKREELGMEGTKFKKHIVICGWTSISRVSLEELLVADQNVVVITNDQNEIPKVRDMGSKKNLFVVFGQYSNRKVLNRANVKYARTVIVATGDDTETLIASLTIKSLNPDVRLIVSIAEEELKKTLYSAGVTYVSSPAELTGRLVASAAFEPEVALFVEDITSATAGYDLQQYTIGEGSFAKGKTVKKFREMMAEVAGPLLVGVAIYKPKKGEKTESPSNWELKPNPDSALKLKNNDIIIVLGDDDQNDKLYKLIKTPQGR